MNGLIDIDGTPTEEAIGAEKRQKSTSQHGTSGTTTMVLTASAEKRCGTKVRLAMQMASVIPNRTSPPSIQPLTHTFFCLASVDNKSYADELYNSEMRITIGNKKV
jgi:hypothetical protein